MATGLYVDYWKQQARDADEYLFPGRSLQLLVFTDRVDEVVDFGRKLSRAVVTAVPVESLGWPAATAKRYELIAESAELVSGEVVMHLDADMRIRRPVGDELDPRSWLAGLALVRHPGYFRGSSLLKAQKDPRRVLADLRMLTRSGGLGAWEEDPLSAAYVPRANRRVYVCGGVWFGQRDTLLRMCELLAERTTRDEREGVMARWHDESHLNWYAAHNDVTLLDPRYCYVDGEPRLRGLPNVIEAVEKGDNRVRD